MRVYRGRIPFDHVSPSANFCRLRVERQPFVLFFRTMLVCYQGSRAHTRVRNERRCARARICLSATLKQHPLHQRTDMKGTVVLSQTIPHSPQLNSSLTSKQPVVTEALEQCRRAKITSFSFPRSSGRDRRSLSCT